MIASHGWRALTDPVAVRLSPARFSPGAGVGSIGTVGGSSGSTGNAA